MVPRTLSSMLRRSQGLAPNDAGAPGVSSSKPGSLLSLHSSTTAESAARGHSIRAGLPRSARPSRHHRPQQLSTPTTQRSIAHHCRSLSGPHLGTRWRRQTRRPRRLARPRTTPTSRLGAPCVKRAPSTWSGRCRPPREAQIPLLRKQLRRRAGQWQQSQEQQEQQEQLAFSLRRGAAKHGGRGAGEGGTARRRTPTW